MSTENAITRISHVLQLVAQPTFDKQAVRALRDIIDEKHWHYIEQGLEHNDKAKLMHGLVGALSHYEAERTQQRTA